MQLPEIKALIRVTTECNVHCRHCYVRSGNDSKEEINQQVLEKIVEELASHRIHSVCFTGGQPTLTGERLINIIRFTSALRKRTGFPSLIQLTSNAMIGENERIADYWVSSFQEAGLDRVRLSCDDWHREYIPETFEQRFIAKARENNLDVKILRVVNPGNRIDENDETNPAEKIFALRPGGRGSSEEYSAGWNNIRHCRIYQASHHPSRLTIFIHPTRDIHICNAGIPMDLSMGKILDDDLDTLLFGKKKGIVGILSREDVEGLASFLGMDPRLLGEKIREKGRCAVCAELRSDMHLKSVPERSGIFN